MKFGKRCSGYTEHTTAELWMTNDGTVDTAGDRYMLSKTTNGEEKMTDRELLELAAKAYGFGADSGGFIWTCSEYPRGTNKSGALWNYKGWLDTAELWNPLEDDGDALRLAVQLNIDIEISDCGAETWAFDDEGGIDVHVLESANHCKLSATRRAIVRAAAEIGAQM